MRVGGEGKGASMAFATKAFNNRVYLKASVTRFYAVVVFCINYCWYAW